MPLPGNAHTLPVRQPGRQFHADLTSCGRQARSFAFRTGSIFPVGLTSRAMLGNMAAASYLVYYAGPQANPAVVIRANPAAPTGTLPEKAICYLSAKGHLFQVQPQVVHVVPARCFGMGTRKFVESHGLDKLFV